MCLSCLFPSGNLRGLSHLALCVGTWRVFPLAWFVWAYLNTDPRQNNRSEIAWTRWSRLDWKRTLVRFGWSEKAIRSNGQTNQAISQCMVGNCVCSVKSIHFVVLLIPQNEPVNEHVFAIQNQRALFHFLMPSFCSSSFLVHLKNVFPMNPGLLLKIIRFYNDNKKNNNNKPAKLLSFTPATNYTHTVSNNHSTPSIVCVYHFPSNSNFTEPFHVSWVLV